MTYFHPFTANVGNPDLGADLLGGKGFGLHRMSVMGYPVPPGVVIDTTRCAAFEADPEKTMNEIMEGLVEHLLALKDHFGFMPLLSVRSGAPVSMPGMMDTILNVGLTRAVLPAWKERIGDRAAYDSYRRLLSMLGTTALGLDHHQFELNVDATKKAMGFTTDQEVTAEGWQSVAKRHWTTYQNNTGAPPPDTLDDQVRRAIAAVFRSWNSDRAKAYRAMEKIPDDMGTAVTVQAMVFGNMNDQSGSGVLFTRNPSTGERVILGEFLPNAQGEDVVAGIRTPLKLEEMATMPAWADVYQDLRKMALSLEEDAADMQDIEFTVQDQKLYLLQTRNGKRTAQAAFKIALDLVEEGKINRLDMYKKVKASQYAIVSRPQLDPNFSKKADWTGIAASPGVATGYVVFSAEEAVEQAKADYPVILVTKETTPDDIAGMAASAGVLTQQGGATSHAAVVARGMNKPCVVGAVDMKLPGAFAKGEQVSICGATGRVWKGKVPVVDASADATVNAFMQHLFHDHDLILRSPAPTAGACVSLVDWLGQDQDQIDKWLEDAKKLDDEGVPVVYDATDPEAFGDENDKIIWEVFGEVPEQRQFFTQIIKPLARLQLKHASVIAPNLSIRKHLETSGMSGIRQAFTVYDLIHEEGMVDIAPALTMYLGQTPEEYTKALEALKPAMKAKLFGRTLSKEDAAFAVLPSA